ncbi:hypothetical protein PGT21_010269 [Puccinia graminis f. sp. tritici]|uniref:Uncharacterized protein n=1 Tax=Puccinia graminis f. sp. tritici TaxID=56615 RepID=A0A5B0NFK6_PUCGR|nr:hypothetical protein PGT21_010269 [Puccinia graminis f. sp. tritici]
MAKTLTSTVNRTDDPQAGHSSTPGQMTDSTENTPPDPVGKLVPTRRVIRGSTSPPSSTCRVETRVYSCTLPPGSSLSCS